MPDLGRAWSALAAASWAPSPLAQAMAKVSSSSSSSSGALSDFRLSGAMHLASLFLPSPLPSIRVPSSPSSHPQATRVKVNSLPPPVLAATLASLAALHRGQAAGQRRRRRQGALDSPPADPQGGQQQQQQLWPGPGSILLPEEDLRELLGDLSVWSANKTMNFR